MYLGDPTGPESISVGKTSCPHWKWHAMTLPPSLALGTIFGDLILGAHKQQLKRELGSFSSQLLPAVKGGTTRR